MNRELGGRRMSFEKTGDHVLLHVERLRKSQKVNTISGAEDSTPNFSSSLVAESSDEEENLIGDEERPLIQVVDCRICQEEDRMENLEVPCACNGSLKYAHRACIQCWRNEKGDTTCEICHVQYKPWYTTPQIHLDETTIDINGSWLITGSTLDLHDCRLLAMTEAHHHLVEADYDGYASNDSGSVFCRSVTLILMVLLLLRHALFINNVDGNEGDDDVDDSSAFFSLFLLRAVGFLLPCYFMAWVITIMQRQKGKAGSSWLSSNWRGIHTAVRPTQGQLTRQSSTRFAIHSPTRARSCRVRESFCRTRVGSQMNYSPFFRD